MGQANQIGIVGTFFPGISDSSDRCTGAFHFYVFALHPFMLWIRDEEIDTGFSFRLETIGYKPSQSFHFIEDHHIIIVGRIERHAQLLWSQISVGIDVVAGDEEVITANRTVPFGRIIDRGAIGKDERVVVIVIAVDVHR